MIVHVQCTKSQLGMQVGRVNWVSQCRRAHHKVSKPKKTPCMSNQHRPSSQVLPTSFFCTSIMHSSSQYCSREYHHCSRAWYFTHSYWREFDSLVYSCYSWNIQPNLCLDRLTLYASVEFLSSFSSLWWPQLEILWTKQLQPYMVLQISLSIFPKMLLHASFMWGSVQETVQEYLDPVKQLKVVRYNKNFKWTKVKPMFFVLRLSRWQLRVHYYSCDCLFYYWY